MKLKFIGTFILFCFFNHIAAAAISLSGTRVIYPQGKKEIALEIKNHGSQPVLTQNWIDDGNSEASPDKLNTPFVITPPIARINPEQGQSLRITAVENTLPRDRESVFWINVLEIPAVNKTAVNKLQMAFRTRIKLFYRPEGLAGTPEKAAQQLSWRKVSATQLEAINNTPWSVSLAGVASGNWKTVGDVVPAWGKKTFTIKRGHALASGGDITWTYINDYGAERSANGLLKN